MHSSAKAGVPPSRMQRAGLARIGALTGAALVAVMLILPTAVAVTQENPTNVFAPFPADGGLVQTVTGPSCTSAFNGANGADVCTTSNPFLQPNFGTAQGNGQSCETCHQPQLGWSVTPDFLQGRFSDTQGTAAPFRVNDTVTDPRVCGAPTATTSQADNAANVNACVTGMSLAQKQQAFKLFVTMGIHRIAIKNKSRARRFHDHCHTPRASTERKASGQQARVARSFHLAPTRRIRVLCRPAQPAT